MKTPQVRVVKQPVKKPLVKKPIINKVIMKPVVKVALPKIRIAAPTIKQPVINVRKPNITAKDFIIPTPTPFIVPVAFNYDVSSIFGDARDYGAHEGIDLAPRGGEPFVLASANGVVSRVEFSPVGWGNHVFIQHENGIETLYAHLSEIVVNVGTPVTQGQIIGIVGSTGNSTGTHLHFSIRENGNWVNPLRAIGDYLNGQSVAPHNYLAPDTSKGIDKALALPKRGTGVPIPLPPQPDIPIGVSVQQPPPVNTSQSVFGDDLFLNPDANVYTQMVTQPTNTTTFIQSGSGNSSQQTVQPVKSRLPDDAKNSAVFRDRILSGEFRDPVANMVNAFFGGRNSETGNPINDILTMVGRQLGQEIKENLPFAIAGVIALGIVLFSAYKIIK